MSTRRLIEIWLAANEGLASDEDVAQLNHTLVLDPAARAWIIQLVRQQAWLKWNGSDHSQSQQSRLEAAHRFLAIDCTPDISGNPDSSNPDCSCTPNINEQHGGGGTPETIHIENELHELLRAVACNEAGDGEFARLSAFLLKHPELTAQAMWLLEQDASLSGHPESGATDAVACPISANPINTSADPPDVADPDMANPNTVDIEGLCRINGGNQSRDRRNGSRNYGSRNHQTSGEHCSDTQPLANPAADAQHDLEHSDSQNCRQAGKRTAERRPHPAARLPAGVSVAEFGSRQARRWGSHVMVAVLAFLAALAWSQMSRTAYRPNLAIDVPGSHSAGQESTTIDCYDNLDHRAWGIVRSGGLGITSQLPNAVRLVSSTGCMWDLESGNRPVVGEVLSGGAPLQLLEGIAEFDVGWEPGGRARFRLEGPAAMVLRSDAMPTLRFGRLLADARADGGPFALDTSVGRINIDAGAAIGVDAMGNDTELHVFRGRAFVESLWPLEDGWPYITLHEGEAAVFESQGVTGFHVTRTTANQQLFASTRSMSTDRLIIPPEYVDAVLDSDPVVYWRFPTPSNSVATGNHERVFPRTSTMLPLVKGELNWPAQADNRVVEFGTTPSGGVVLCDTPWPAQPLHNYTVELWVKPSHFHHGAIFSLVGEQADDSKRTTHGFLVEIGGPYNRGTHSSPINAFRFLHRSPPSFGDGQSCSSDVMYKVRHWQHVVAVKEGPEMRLYLDGKQVGGAEDPTPLPAGLRIVLGQLYPESAVRPFIGQLDEIALYARALDETEIRRHYDLIGTPPKVDPSAI